MILRKICSGCGGRVEELILTSFPAQYRDECTRCGAQRDYPASQVRQVVVDMGEDTAPKYIRA